MASNTISVDPRIVNPLVCYPDDPLSRFPRDTLHRIASTLSLNAELIGNTEGDPLGSKEHCYAFSLQLDGMASVLKALADALIQREPAIKSNEVILGFAEDELEKLTIIAARKGQSVRDATQSIVVDWLKGFDPSRRNGEGVE